LKTMDMNTHPVMLLVGDSTSRHIFSCVGGTKMQRSAKEPVAVSVPATL
jgi:hypothetical protein